MERQRLIRIFRTATSRGFSAGGTFLLTLVAARVLDSHELGVFFAAFTILITTATVAQFGMDTGITWVVGHLAPNGDSGNVRKWLALNCCLAFVFSILLLLTLFLSRRLIAQATSLPELSSALPMMLLAMPPFAIGSIVGGALRGLGDSEFAGLQSGGASFLAAVEIVVMRFCFSNMTLPQVEVCYLVASILVCVFLLLTFGLFTAGREQAKEGSNFSAGVGLPNLKDYLRRCWHMWVGQICGAMITFWPTLLLANLISADALASFKVSERIVALVGVFLVVLTDVFSPRYSYFYRSARASDLKKEIQQSSRIIFLFAALPAGIIMLFSRQIITIFHPDFAVVYYIIPVMMLGQLVNILTGPAGNLLAMTDDQRSYSTGQLVGLVVALVSYPLLIHWAGLLGAAIAWAIVVASQNIYFAVAVSRHLRVWPVPFWPRSRHPK